MQYNTDSFSAKINLLKELYGKITIPNAVFQEIEIGSNKLYYKDLSVIKRIEIKHIKNRDSIQRIECRYSNFR